MKRRNNQPADLLHEPQKYAPDSSRPCLACGHAVPHNSSDGDGPGGGCSSVTFTKECCENPHTRYSAKCAKRGAIDSCWISQTPCECTEDDRVMADLYAHVATLNSAIAKAALVFIL